MSLDGVHIHIEYEDESVLRRAIKGLGHGKKEFSLAITHDGKKMTCGYYSTFRTAQFNGLFSYEYLVYLFDSLPYKEDKSFDYTSYLPWADGIRERVKERIFSDAYK